MKQFLNELNLSQLAIYKHLKEVTTDDGSNFKENLVEMEEDYESVSERISSIYNSLSDIEKIEVIHFFTKYLMKKNSDK